ncbi:GNAT family N-acetyltransferase [uncultured Tateyamaria sp.]|uniref:GNAT family N-acetyltransferase n=1 Tax=uncultured Tateyamaria sp. TaxID=455651 RepID=UPI002630AB37|nr:GNAT family N-acetyltransferase [uncultured Tateyamaria sp.]
MITLTGTPILTTERLTLRVPQPQDAETFIAFYKTDRAKYVGGPKDDRRGWDFFCTEIGHWVMNGFGMFVVTYHNDDTPLGIVGHWYPNTWPEKEVGWVLFDAKHEGKGIAFEAATACIDHAWNTLNWDTIVSYIAHGNDASVALAERLGAVRDDKAEEPGKEAYVYRHPRPTA